MKSATRTAVPWLTSEAAAEHLGFFYGADVVVDGVVVHRKGDVNVHAFNTWRYRAKPRTYRLRSSGLRFRETDLDACLDPERPKEKA